MVKLKILVWALAIFCLAVFSSAALADENVTTRLQTVLNDFHTANPSAPGVVVHVESPSRDLDWTAAVGLAVRDSADPLTADCTFRIASNTKTYVAAAILRLAETGKLSLDDPLAGYLPADQQKLLADDGYDLDAMTIRQVLAHTSGLFEHPADPRYEKAILADPHHRWTRLEQITKCVEWGDPVGAPGKLFSYSDTGYVILGGIIEKLTGENLGAAVRGLLDFDGLGLKSTWWEFFEEQPAGAGPRAHQYYRDLDTYDWDPSLDLYGGGGLVCDVRDLALFTRLLLDGRVLEPSSLEEMTSAGTLNYGLGLVNINLGDFLAQGHAGFWNTFVFHVAELDLTVSGCILNHHAEKGRELAWLLVKAVAPESP
ncbi:MAG: beta-lactamase family protein [Candidatus Krumholzibacteria bacterium]|nr:beta-lactamase family protein [Candidatus Krumholzibacteria bacterium]